VAWLGAPRAARFIAHKTPETSILTKLRYYGYLVSHRAETCVYTLLAARWPMRYGYAVLSSSSCPQPDSHRPHSTDHTAHSTSFFLAVLGLNLKPYWLKKERKKTDNPREGWEDGTPPPHRDFKERCVLASAISL